MVQFDYKGFLKEGGIEKYLLEEQFGNDIESRYQYIRPLMSGLPDSARTEAMIDGMEEARAEDDKMAFDFYFVETMKMLGLETELMEADSLINPEAEENFGNDIESRYAYIRPLMVNLPDTARTEAMIDGMEDAKAEDDKMAFDFYFVETMKMLGLENELMEADSLINPEAEEIEDDDLGAAADYFDSLTENDDILDEMLDENMITPGDKVFFRTDTGMEKPMKVVKVRRQFGTNFLAATVEDMDGKIVGEYDDTQLVKFPEKKFFNPEEKANVFVRELEGEVQSEAMSNQLKINKLLQAANTIEDSLNDVNLELTDDQIDNFTEMILDLRAKAKAKLK